LNPGEADQIRIGRLLYNKQSIIKLHFRISRSSKIAPESRRNFKDVESLHAKVFRIYSVIVRTLGAIPDY
jgi:hypothetical protein